ncbi:Transcriptional regulatory protein QseB [Afipia felis]|uniref:Transcriptional regulatory protein QseB n=1 Tax=Afipia felis TaxID=1035 RepID=A0A090MU02_AFIFE|nr:MULTISPECIES: response regulator transcription factor [Afipia]EFI51406.1 two component transcriptional regulator, winged helix family [Afipia sp. 1NLS2]CEG09134.1 Transcriptional regulatory protein QseB [Afipia felis]
MRILIVEDDPVISNGLKVGLGMFGATLDVVSTCADGRAAAALSEFDALVLDVMLPDGSGLDLLTELRAGGDRTPVLMLTALDEIADRIKGLDSGADDYIGKPFDLDELAARVRAICRRQTGRASPCLTFNGLTLDPAQMTVTVNDETNPLSRREFSILSALMSHPGRVMSKNEIESRLYGWQEEIESNTVEVHIHKLRTKVGREKIETIRGIGYRMRLDS